MLHFSPVLFEVFKSTRTYICGFKNQNSSHSSLWSLNKEQGVLIISQSITKSLKTKLAMNLATFTYSHLQICKRVIVVIRDKTEKSQLCWIQWIAFILLRVV